MKILRRDGYTCSFTSFPFQQATGPGVVPRCAHVIPFSFLDKVCKDQIVVVFSTFQDFASPLRGAFWNPSLVAESSPKALRHASMTLVMPLIYKAMLMIFLISLLGESKLGNRLEERFASLSFSLTLRCKSPFNSGNIYTVRSTTKFHLRFPSMMETKLYFARGRRVNKLNHPTPYSATRDLLLLV